MRKAIFLDRDGVLIKSAVRNGKPFAIDEGEAVEIIDGVLKACADLAAAGFMLIMVSNQPDVARGRTSRAFVEGVNTELVQALQLDEVLVCFHDDSDKCNCRKPKPGLMLDAASRHNLELSHCIMVGDRWRDIEAGRNAGVITVLVDYGYDETRPEAPDYTAKSLADAAHWICSTLAGGFPIEFSGSSA